jgi:hypothetical protein
MIRNYYTEAYSSAVSPSVSDTLLIDGRTKSETPQGDWKQYNIYVGDSPASLPVTTTTDNNAVNNSTNVSLKSPNPLIKAGMIVKGAGLPTSGLAIASVTDASNYVLASADTIAADATLTYTYAVSAKLKVHTVNDEAVTFHNPVKGEILPVSVVQVYATGTEGGVENLVALS